MPLSHCIQFLQAKRSDTLKNASLLSGWVSILAGWVNRPRAKAAQSRRSAWGPCLRLAHRHTYSNRGRVFPITT